MKLTYYFLLAICISTTISCSKIQTSVTVVKDCTGSYLRHNEKDYHICNIEKVEGFENGDEVQAFFEKISDCDNGEIIVCEKIHRNEGWIVILKIK